MYQLIIATDMTTSTTAHDDVAHAHRALVDFAVVEDFYMCGDHPFGEAADRLATAMVFALLALDPSGRQPSRVGTATIASPDSQTTVVHRDLTAEVAPQQSEASVTQNIPTMWGAHTS